MSIRYGARPPEARRNREVEAVQRQIWTQAVTVVFETDPSLIAAVLPPPLEVSDPTARLRIATVDMGTGLKPFGAGWFGVRCRHGSTEGEYALFMPMTTEQATIGGRETFGEPKKVADVTLQLDGSSVSAYVERMGFRIAEISGQLGDEAPGYEKDKIDFYFKLSPSPDGVGLDGDPPFVYCHRHESARAVRRIDGELKLMESPLDPVADFPVQRIVSMEYAELAGTQRGEIVGTVPAADLLPYVHQRYDDLSVLGARVVNPSERYCIVSADGHAGLPAEEYRSYLDSKFYGAFDAYLAERHVRRDEALRMNYDYIMGWETQNAEGLKGAYDAAVRNKELDADGVSAEVIFADADAITGMASPPFGAGLSAGEIDDPDLAFAGARAHNRFLVDLCSNSPERRAGIALVPICHGPERAVEEVEWVAQHPGIRGVMVPTMWHDRPPYHDPVYDPVWAACQAHGLPVHTHSGEAPHAEYGDHIGIYLAEVVWWAVRPGWHMLFGGVFERYPDLKFVVTEAAAYWAADMMWKWDQYMGGGHTTKKMAALLEGRISKLPSDYFGTNLFIGASTMSKEEIRRRHIIGCDVMMWGTDYPHPEGTWPHTVERLQSSFNDVPVEDTRKLLSETAARVYGFDMDVLRPIADRVGPTPEALGQDPSLRTDPDEVANARWWKKEYGISG